MTEKRAVIYSLYINEDCLFDSIHYRQLIYSIKTLRSFSDIPVKIYVNDISLLNKSSRKTIKDFYHNIEFVHFDSSEYNVKPNNTLYPWQRCDQVIHKWPNACKAFKQFDLDKILYLDADTIFYKSIDDIFDLYQNGLFIRKEWEGFNDGVFILDKNTASYIDSFYLEKYAFFRESFIEKHSKNFNIDKISWIAYQHASSDLFKSMNIDIQYLDRFHVRKLDDEENEYWNEDKFNDGNLFLIHYFSHNFRRCVPSSHW